MKQSALFSTIDEAIEDIRQGKMVILVDDASRENEGDLVIAAEKITPEAINFMITYGRGLVCMPMSADIVNRLGLRMMIGQNKSKFGTAFTQSIGSAQGTTTGISAADRAHTIKVAADPNSTADDIVSPGHIFPLRALEGGVLEREGHTEGSVDLVKLAGLQPAATICEVIKTDGTMARLDDLTEFAKTHGLSMVSIADLISYRMMHENLVREVSTAALPLEHFGEFEIKVFENQIDGAQHIALIREPLNKDKPCLVRIHSQCVTGDIFGSARCDCGPQLQTALEIISQEGGIVLYLTNHEGRGIGLANKVKAYALQDKGLDTVEANHKLGFAEDERDYGIAAQILHQLGLQKVNLLTNNPRKINGIQYYGIEVSLRQPLEMQPNAENIRYLQTKKNKLGHMLSLAQEKTS